MDVTQQQQQENTRVEMDVEQQQQQQQNTRVTSRWRLFGYDITDGGQHHEDQSSDRPLPRWRLFGQDITSKEAILIVQIILLYVVITTCLMNLSTGNEVNSVLLSLMQSTVGENSFIPLSPSFGQQVEAFRNASKNSSTI